MLKQGIILGVSLLGTSMTYAGTFAGCNDKDAVCQKSKYGFALTGLYLQAYSNSLPGGSSYKPPGDWAGSIEGNYYLKDKTDLTLNWLHYNLNYTRPITKNSPGVRADNYFNSINAEIGQTFDLSPRGSIRLSGGLQYLNLDMKPRNIYRNFVGGVDNFKFRAIGPRMGVNAQYKINETFSVFANSAASILLGRSARGHRGFSSFVRRDIAIPELEAKLGLSYSRPFQRGVVSFSGGWTVVNYFNLLGSDRQNLTFSGPFVEARWRG